MRALVHGPIVGHTCAAPPRSPKRGQGIWFAQRRHRWYGVVHGFVSGVYDNWADVVAQVNEYHGNVFQLFSTYEEVVQFVEKGIRAFQDLP